MVRITQETNVCFHAEGNFGMYIINQGQSKLHELLWAPCLWDYWFNEKANMGFYSFAMITDAPPPEIEAMGHDLCPIFLRADQIDAWLTPKGKSKDELYSILQMREQVVYSHEWLAG